MSAADEKHTSENRDEFESVENGMCRLKRVFASSGRTTCPSFSSDVFMRSPYVAERKVTDTIEAARNYDDTGKLRKSDFVTSKRDHFADVDVGVSVRLSSDMAIPIWRTM